ncbi:hypothetical protein IE81DRAFT_338236 [Ceraceosorus guamensis]|uniref:Band 7 domain-containing protein n=1 Tax=Ceraceosorus guamensis TaxID=1522189 RepID=A0A316VQZ2_9BASI|nr:hypothetical protein IE81DRAFT_338236 [Ceraceosorus guamensis]PWN40079.1 hypothetical protein IE81DRAFT_338236 [Ceraceosorus guamensis]
MSDFKAPPVPGADDKLASGQDAFASSSGGVDHQTSDDDFNLGGGPSHSSQKRPLKAPPAGDALIKVQPLKKADMQPSYAQDLGLQDVEHGFYGSMINGLGACAGFFGQLPCCFCFPNPFKEVNQGSVGLVSRFGQFYRSVDPGLVAINPCSETLRIVDVKINLSVLPRQTVMTKDNVTIDIEAVCYWHVTSPYRAAFGVGDVRAALIERAQSTLRDVVGSRTLQALITDREGVAVQVEEIVAGVAEKWGVSVEAILIRDLLFSKDLEASLSSAATQRRIGESKVVAARAEVQSAKLMRQAADVLATPAAMQIRQLESLQAMAKTSGAKTIFVPMNLMGGESAMSNLATTQQLSSI